LKKRSNALPKSPPNRRYRDVRRRTDLANRPVSHDFGKNRQAKYAGGLAHLQAYMHGGVGFEPYRRTFRELIPSDNFVYQEMYNASEGYFGVQCDFGHNDMLMLADNGVFYEFVPIRGMGQNTPAHGHAGRRGNREKTTPSSSVPTTACGATTPGDTVQFTRKYPFCFRISGRTKQFINAFGEEVMVGDTDKALAERLPPDRFARVRVHRRARIFFRGPQQGRTRMGGGI
jgi:hypothetical protein